MQEDSQEKQRDSTVAPQTPKLIRTPEFYGRSVSQSEAEPSQPDQSVPNTASLVPSDPTLKKRDFANRETASAAKDGQLTTPQRPYPKVGFDEPLPADREKPADMNEGTLPVGMQSEPERPYWQQIREEPKESPDRPTIPKAKLNPLISFNKGRFAGPKAKADQTIREIPNDSGDE